MRRCSSKQHQEQDQQDEKQMWGEVKFSFWHGRSVLELGTLLLSKAQGPAFDLDVREQSQHEHGAALRQSPKAQSLLSILRS